MGHVFLELILEAPLMPREQQEEVEENRHSCAAFGARVGSSAFLTATYSEPMTAIQMAAHSPVPCCCQLDMQVWWSLIKRLLTRLYSKSKSFSKGVQREVHERSAPEARK